MCVVYVPDEDVRSVEQHHAYFVDVGEANKRTVFEDGGAHLLTAAFDAARMDGDLPAHRDPRTEAMLLVALWDGLQIQWLYARDAVDIEAALADHLEDVLPSQL
ncbi:hypothetical protein GCM10025738_15030 [Microbacterium fluvii]